MSILSKLGSSVGRKAGVGLVGAAVMGHGFAQGFGERNVSDNAYSLLFNDPNIDKEVFGRDLNPISALAPMPLGTVNSMKSGGLRGATASFAGGFINSTSVGDHFKNNSYYRNENINWSNQPPKVDGSIVFGLLNSRHG
jgi:hypothetical protein